MPACGEAKRIGTNRGDEFEASRAVLTIQMGTAGPLSQACHGLTPFVGRRCKQYIH